MTEIKKNFYSDRGNRIIVMSHDPRQNVVEVLPPGIYTPHTIPMGPDYFEKENTFEVPSKMYGNIESRVNKVISAYHDRSISTGVLLSGEKGSGKTLLLKMVCNELSKTMPVINMSDIRNVDGFSRYLSLVGQDAVIIADEFEKMFPKEEQELLLTILDGTKNHKNLFIFTCNEKYKITEFMINRPGRIYYNFTYERLPKDFITEYINDNLKNKDHEIPLINLLDKSTGVNFDGLSSIVYEMNRLNLPFADIIEDLNVTIAFSNNGFKYMMSVFDKNTEKYILENQNITLDNSIYDNEGFVKFTNNWFIQTSKMIEMEQDGRDKFNNLFDFSDVMDLDKGVVFYKAQNQEDFVKATIPYVVSYSSYSHEHLDYLDEDENPKISYEEYVKKNYEKSLENHKIAGGRGIKIDYSKFSEINNLSNEKQDGLTFDSDRFRFEIFTSPVIERKGRYLFGSTSSNAFRDF